MLKKLIYLSALAFCAFTIQAAEITGKVQSTSVDGQAIQFINPKTKEVNVLKFNKDTKLVDAESFKDFTHNTKFKATIDDNMLASKLRRILVLLPAEQIIDTDTLEEMLADGKPVFVGDARPVKSYDVGHIPTSHATPANKLAKNLQWLPKDKNTAIVFYCGGITCPLSPKAMNIATKQGYTNVKAYVEGIPAWKGDVYPTHVNPEWLSKNLDVHHIVLDVRKAPKTHIKTAIHLPVTTLQAQHKQWNTEKFPTSKRTFLGLRDKKAVITLIGDNDDSDDVIEAYELLTFWKFNRVNILKGGMNSWIANNLPVESNAFANKLNYTKKLAKGAIDEKDFAKAVKDNSATIIDLRGVEEASHDHLKNAINIPFNTLEQNLNKVPKDGLVVLHCLGGARALLAYTMLTKKGYKNVKWLDDSFVDVAKDNGIKLYGDNHAK